MPIAEPFKTLGLGNGFARCPRIFDISKGDLADADWITLNGINNTNYTNFSGDALKAKVEESRKMAMNIYWNKYKLTGYKSSASGNSVTKSLSSHPEDGLKSFYPHSSGPSQLTGMTDSDATNADILQPKDRAVSRFGLNLKSEISRSERVIQETESMLVSRPGSEIQRTLGGIHTLIAKESTTVAAITNGNILLGYTVYNPMSQNFFAKSAVGGLKISCSINISGIISGLDRRDDRDEEDATGRLKIITVFDQIDGMWFVFQSMGSVSKVVTPSETDELERDSGWRTTVNDAVLNVSSKSVSASYNLAYNYSPDLDFGVTAGRFNIPKFFIKKRSVSCSAPNSFDFYTY